MERTIEMMALQIAATQLAVVMWAHVVDGVDDAVDAHHSEIAALSANDGASTFEKLS